MPSIAGRLALVKMSGATTSFTDEAVTVLTTNQVYQITATTKRVWDPTATITVKAAGVAVDPVADPYTINRLTGTVSFTNVSARGTVTTSGHYLPMTTIAKTKSVMYSLDSPVLDDTTFDSAGWSECIAGIKTATASIGRNWESVSGALLYAALAAGTPLVLQIFSNRNAAADLLMWALPTKKAASVTVSTIVGDALDFVGAPDADLRVVSTS